MFAQQNSITCIDNEGRNFAAIKDLETSLSPYRVGNICITKVPLDGRDGQSFYLSVKPQKVVIKYTTENSLENAVYTYLGMLGIHWYGPTADWFVNPVKLHQKEIDGKWFSPTFRNRSINGTGGLEFGTLPSYDFKNDYKKNWLAFKRRNRFNADFSVAGHMGQAFYLDNKLVLDKQKEWFTNDQGRMTGRIKIDKKEAVDFFTNWAIKNVKANKAAFNTISVDPEDGRGGPDDPLPPNGFKGIKNWNHADKWWWLANEVSKQFDENDKNTKITMLAYGDGAYNALAPKFSLRKNVYPVIIPYAFQKAYTPTEMLTTWASKIEGSMGLYDYWNITQWSEGLPQFNMYNIPEKLTFWKKNKVDGIYLETTDAAGPMGHIFWMAGELQWDNNQSIDVLLNQYTKDCFGKAAAPIKEMLLRWSLNYQGAADVDFSLRDLERASNLVNKGAKEWIRIAYLKAYVHYMKLYYEHDGTQQSRDKIFNYLYTIHHLSLVQTSAFITQSYIFPGGPAPSDIGSEPASFANIEKQFQKDIKTSNRVYQLLQTDFNYDKVKYTEPIPDNSWLFGGYQCGFHFKAPFSGFISLDVGAEYDAEFIFSSEGNVITKEFVGSKNFDYREQLINNRTWSLKKFKIKIEKGVMYNINLSGGFSRVKMKTEGIVLFKNPGMQDFDNAAYPVQYFYVPKAATEIIFSDGYGEGLNGRGFLIPPNGVPLKREAMGPKYIYRVPVQPEQRGKIWIANFGHPTWSFKNIPNVTALQKFEYLEY